MPLRNGQRARRASAARQETRGCLGSRTAQVLGFAVRNRVSQTLKCCAAILVTEDANSAGRVKYASRRLIAVSVARPGTSPGLAVAQPITQKKQL